MLVLGLVVIMSSLQYWYLLSIVYCSVTVAYAVYSYIATYCNVHVHMFVHIYICT